MAENYEIQLGIGLNDSDFSNIKTKIKSLEDDRIKIKLDTKDADSQIDGIKKQLQDLNKGNNKNLFTLDTSKLESSLTDVKNIITDIKNALGTIDNSKGINSLVSSVNQISKVLDTASNKIEGLSGELSALSKKDFSFNLDFKIGGGSASKRSGAYGIVARETVIPQLQQQAKALEDFFKSQFKAADEYNAIFKLMQGTSVLEKSGVQLGQLYNDMIPNASKRNLSTEMTALKQYIALIKEAAQLKGFNSDVDSILSGFSKSSDELVQEARDIQSGAKEAKESVEQFKNIFSSGIDAEGLSAALDPILQDLKSIREAIEGLSKGSSIEGLTQSFNRLSETLDKLVANFANVKNAIGDGFSGGAAKTAQQTGQKIGETVSKYAKQSLNIDDVIDEQVSALMNEYVIAGNKGSKAFEEIKQALNDFRNGSGDINKVTSAISNNMKVVNEAKNDYKELAEYIKMFNASGAKVHIQDSIKQEYGDDYKSMRSQLGKGFTSGKGMDFETFVVELNSILGQTIDLSHGAEAAFGDLVNKVNSTKGGKFLTGDDLFKNGILDMGDVVANVSTSLEQIENAEEEIARTSTTAATGLKNVENDLKQVTITADNTADAIDSMKNAMSSMKFNDASIDAVTKDLEEMNVVIEKVTAKEKNGVLQVTVKGINEAKEAVTVVKQLDDVTGNFNIVSTQISKPFEKGAEAARNLKKEVETVKNIKLNIELGNVENEIDSMRSKFNSLSDANTELRISVEKVENAYEEMLRVANANTGDEVADRERLIQAEKEYAAALEKTNNLIKIQARQDKIDADNVKLQDDRDIFKAKIDSWLTNNSAATKKFGAQLRQLKKDAETADRVQLNHLNKELQKVDRAADKAGLKMQSLGDRISTKFKEYSAYFSVAELFMYVEQGLRSMFEQVKLIDSAMTELKKVTDETDASYERFLTNAASKAKEIGTTIDGLVSSTADFARLGYDFADAQGLAEVANIYAVVGDDIDNVEQATQSLISTLTAFKDEANGLSDSDFAMSIVDKMNEVANNYAISSGGIGDALQRSASSMMAANNSLDETIALITAANTVVQDPDAIGTAFKTISMRIRGAKTEMEEAGLETDGMADSTAKLREEILALSGVDIMLNSNEFKSTYQIMKELADKWKDLSDIQQASVTELIAGKRQGNIVSSLMNNFDIAEKALETSMNSAGSAMREHEKWQQSLEAQILKLKAAWQGLSQAFLSSDFLKTALDGIIGLVDGITKLIDAMGTIPTLFAGFVGFKSVKTILSTIGKGGSLKEFGNILGVLQRAFPNITKGIGKLVSSLKDVSLASGGAGSAFGGFLSLIMQHPYIAIATVAVAALTSAFMYQKKQAEDLAKEVNQLTSEYKEQHNKLSEIKNNYDTSNESSMISKYEKLSKGVDSLGRNVSLTADEYSEYQSIVNQIAEQVPSLVSGYDSQGNALLSCKGNVEKLTEAYEKLIHAQNQEILTNTGNIEKDFENTLKDAEKGSFLGIGKKVSTPSIELLERVLNGDYSAKEIENLLKELSMGQEDGVYEALYNADIGDMGRVYNTKEIAETLAKQLKEDKSKIKNIVDNYYGQFSDAVEEQKTIAQAKLSEAFDISNAISGLNYGNISEELQAIAYQTVNSLDFKFFENLKEKGLSVEQWTTEMLNQLNSISEVDNAKIETAFDLQTQFNGGDISYGEYVGNLRDVESIIDNLDLKSTAKNQLKISLGLDENGIIEQYDTLVNRLTDTDNYDFNISELEAKNLLDGLSYEEFSVAVDVITDLSNNDYNETADEIRNAIEKEIAKQGLSLDLTIEKAKVNFEALSTAISESVSGSGLSEESISAVEDIFGGLSSYDSSKLFERTANGIHLNSTELRKLNDESKKTNIAKVNKQMNSLGDIYNQTREELYQLTYGTDEYNSKLSDLGYIEQQIKDLEKLAAGYDGVASAYQEWQMMESAGSQRGMYEGILEGWENVEDEISRGWIDDGTREFLELLKGEKATIIDGDGNKKEINIATASTKDLKKVWKSLDDTIKHTTYSVEDFFTVDDDGNSTSKGVYNFLDAIGQMEEEKFNKKDVIKRDDNGNIIGFDFQMVGGDKVIAEALGISEELVQIMKRASADAGFVVTLDGSFEQLDILREKAQKAAEVLNKSLKNKGQEDKVFSYDFNSTDEKDIAKQLEKANKALNTFKKSGKIDLSIEGASEALTVASTLQSMLDNLQRPAYMKIEVSQVEEDLQDPLRNLQELRTLTETEHQFKISGTDTSELEKSKQEIYNYFETLDPEVKAKLGLVDDKGNPLTGQALKNKLNSGDIAIEATIDIQMEMDEKLGVLVDKALYDAGIIDKEEFNKRIKVYLEADVNNEDAKDKVEKAVEEESEPSVVKKDFELVAEVTGSNVNEKVDEAINNDTNNNSSHGGSGKRRNTQFKTDVEIKAEEVDDSNIDKIVEEKLNSHGKGSNGKTPKVKHKVKVDLIAERTNDLELSELIKDLDPIEQKVVVEYFAEHDEVDKYTPEQKEALVEFIANSDNLDSYTPEEKEAIVQYLTDSADPDSWTPEQKEAVARFIRESGDVDNYTPEKKEAIAKFIKDSIEPDSYIPPSPDSTVTFLKNSSDVDTYDPPSFTRYVTYYAKKAFTTGAKAGEKALENRFGIGGVNGTANSSGSAFRQGDWRTKRSETALTGELGREIVVTPQNRWYTVGDNGAEFVNIPRGSIVFNHKQTEELLRNGKATSDGGRARALVNGSAFLNGTAHRGDGEWIGTEAKSSSVGKGKSSSKSSEKDFEEVLDWIEVILDRVQRSIDKFDQQANNIYKNWSSRNNALLNQISEVNKEIALQQQAKSKYMAAANGVGLSSSWAAKVRNGEIDIETIKDEALADKIKSYQDYYEKALDCEDAIRELREEESKLYKQRFDNVATEYEGALSIIEHEKNMLEEYISQSEAQAWLVSSKYYDALAKNEQNNIAKLKQEKNALLSSFNSAMQSGTIDKYSEAWYEMVNAVDEVTLAITEGETALKEYQQTLQQLDWEVFDILQERISSITEEADFLIEVMSNSKLYEDNGQLTDKGMASMGLHGQNYNVYMAQADKYAKEVADLNKELKKDPYDQDLINRRDELLGLQRDAILAAEDEKNAIKDLVEEGINLELDALQELIDKKNEELDSAKDLYDYQKKVKEQTKEIASLEKQMAAYSGDDSEEARAKIQELKVSLEEAKSDLEETEYDKYISDTQKILDNLYLEYETILNERLDNLDGLISDMILEINADAGIISDTIRTSSDSVGYTLTDSMNTIWSGANNVITTYGERFSSAQTTTNNALSAINTNLQNMITQLNQKANTNVKSASTSSASGSSQANSKPTTSNTTTNNQKNNNTSKDVKVGSVINASGAPIYDYAGDTSKERQYFRDNPTYIVLEEKGDYVKVRHSSLSGGTTGWFKKSDIGYKTGVKNLSSSQAAWTQEDWKEDGKEFIIRPSDGAILTPLAKGDSVLNAFASDNIWKMANTPAEFIRDNLNLGAVNVPNNSNVNNNYTQNLENIVFNLPNVQNYNELLSAMQKDKNFEKLILSMSIDRLAGGSSLAKGKSIR